MDNPTRSQENWFQIPLLKLILLPSHAELTTTLIELLTNKMMFVCFARIVFILLIPYNVVLCQYEFPEERVEILQPTGFRVSIPGKCAV